MAVDVHDVTGESDRALRDAARRVPLLRGLQDPQLDLVLAACEVVDADAGQVLVEEGATDRDVHILLSGQADILVTGDAGELVQVGTLQPGDTFGELAALLHEPRAATVIQAEPGRLLRLPDTALLDLLDRVGALGLALARDLARDLEVALEQRNQLQEDATPDTVELDPDDLDRGRTGLARFYLATVSNLLRRNRLLTRDHYPTYTTALTVTAEDERRWRELLGVPADAPRIPLTVHTRAWTPLLTRLLEDLGVGARHLRHVRTRLTHHPDDPLLDLDTTGSVQVRLTGTVPVGDDRVALLVDTHVRDAAGAVKLTSEDVFVVSDVDRQTIRALRRRHDGAVPEVPDPTAEEAPTLDPEAPAVHETAVALAADLGVRYGRLSGNLHPVHTTAAAARLLGHARPVLQHLAVANLVLCRLVDDLGGAPQRLELTFHRPVELDQTISLRVAAGRIEVVDAEGDLLVAGTHEGQAAAPQAGPAATAEPTRPVEDDRADEAATPPEAAGFDPVALQRFLERSHHELRDEVRDLLASDALRPPVAPHGDAYRDQVLEWLRVLADRGYGRLVLPASVGGADDPAGGIAVFETLATGDLSLLVKFGVQYGLFGGAILHLGTAEHHERYLRDVASLALPGCFALTETGHGSDARSIRTTATYDPVAGEFELVTPDVDARKDYIGNAARHGRAAVVFAQLVVDDEARGVHAFVVPIRDADGTPLPGVAIEDCGPKMGLNGVDNGRLSFDRVRVPREALLNRYGNVSTDGVYSSPIASAGTRFFTMLSTLVQGRVSVGLAGLAAAKVALTIAVRHGLSRRQFGPREGPETPLLDYLSHQRRLLPALARVVALDVALHDLVDDLVAAQRDPSPDPADRQRVESRAAGLKALATWQATAAIQECREACGGAGYLAENRFAALKADSDVFTTFEGDNTVLLQLVTKALLTDYSQQFEDLDVADLVRYVVGRVVAAVIPTPPSRRADRDHLRDPAFQRDALAAREDLRVAELARRIKGELDRKVDPHEAFIRHQDLVLATARAHVERVAVDAIATAVQRCEDPSSAAVLATLRDLAALSWLDADRAWYLEQGLFAGGKAKAISRQVNELCGELRPLAGDLVTAFGVPDALLPAIGRPR